MIIIKQNNEVYEVSFPYDPLVVDMVKQVAGRRWVSQSKMWTIPRDKLGFLLAQFKGTQYEGAVNIISDEQINQNATLDVTAKIPDIDISKIPYYVKPGGTLYQHQLDFMKYAIYRELKGNMDGFVLADDQGCISGDAVVYVRYGSAVLQYRSYTLETLYSLWEDAICFYNDLEVLCYKDGVLDYHHAYEVVDSDEKPVWCLKLASDYSIKATGDHLILTSTGYKQMKDLVEGDRVVIKTCNTSGVTSFSSVVSKEYVGVEHVYDIKMDDPYHNFVANDIVVHNCGKSLESTNLAIYNKNQYRFQHCLILCCVNSSKYNWVKDIEIHTSGEYAPYILGSRLKKGSGKVQFMGGKEKYDDLMNLKMYGAKKGGKELPYFLILNIEAIRYKVGRKYPLADRLIELIDQRYISMIIIDEVHKNISPTSQQGKQLLRIKKTISETPLWLPMSGTPITKKPLDLYMPLRLINAHGYNSYYLWAKEYCIYGGFGGHEIVGYKNIPRLKAQLQNNMLRRLKDDVLDLPPKIRYTEYVDNTPYQERLYERTAAGLIKQQDEIVKSLNPLSKFLRLRQVNGNPELVEPDCDITDPRYIEKNAKLQRLMELLEEIHERGEKVVIFSNWVESLRTLYKFVSKKYKTCCFTGTMKEADRQKHKEVFMTNPNYTVMMGTFGALGTTHTLTVARNEIMYDEPWNPSDKVQAEDRIYRIGTNQSVNIYTLITRDTVDDRVHDILYTKSGISEFIVDGKLDIVNNPKLFYLLLSDTLKNTNRGEDEYEDHGE